MEKLLNGKLIQTTRLSIIDQRFFISWINRSIGGRRWCGWQIIGRSPDRSDGRYRPPSPGNGYENCTRTGYLKGWVSGRHQAVPPLEFWPAFVLPVTPLTSVADNDVDHLLFDAEYRIEVGHRILEDHGDPGTLNLFDFFSGIIPNENGAGSGVNGWIQATTLNLPIVDAPANGRAHPTGLMGAMGLHRQKDYHSIQSAVGGNPDLNLYVEMICQG